MALIDEVTDRIGAQRLVELTNPQLPSATTIDTTRLARAVTDTVGEFQRQTGETYDANDAFHVSICVDGVICLLQRRMGVPIADTGPCDRFKEALSQFTNVRVAPVTTATQTPTADDSDGLPFSDDRNTAQFIPGIQGSVSEED
jgi:hypothetical protein